MICPHVLTLPLPPIQRISEACACRKEYIYFTEVRGGNKDFFKKPIFFSKRAGDLTPP